jgi:hypothetical protein
MDNLNFSKYSWLKHRGIILSYREITRKSVYREFVYLMYLRQLHTTHTHIHSQGSHVLSPKAVERHLSIFYRIRFHLNDWILALKVAGLWLLFDWSLFHCLVPKFMQKPYLAIKIVWSVKQVSCGVRDKIKLYHLSFF